MTQRRSKQRISQTQKIIPPLTYICMPLLYYAFAHVFFFWDQHDVVKGSRVSRTLFSLPLAPIRAFAPGCDTNTFLPITTSNSIFFDYQNWYCGNFLGSSNMKVMPWYWNWCHRGIFPAPWIWNWCRGTEIDVAEEFFLLLKFETDVAVEISSVTTISVPQHHFCHCNPLNWCAIARKWCWWHTCNAS